MLKHGKIFNYNRILLDIIMALSRKHLSQFSRCAIAAGAVFYQSLGLAWSEHSLITFPILNSMNEIREQQPVVVESLADFVNTEAAGLALMLQKDELWLRNNFPYYLPRPDALKFTIKGNKAEKLQAFIKAIPH